MMAKTKRIALPVDDHVGSKVRECRLAAGMSQAKLGEVIGLSFQQVQMYEKGTNRIGSSRIFQIANALNVEPTYFFDGAPTSARKGADKLGSMQFVSDFVASKDGVQLMRAFIRLPKDVQRSVVDLVAKIADFES